MELEGWTNDRLVLERVARLNKADWVFGVPNASVGGLMDNEVTAVAVMPMGRSPVRRVITLTVAAKRRIAARNS